MRTEARIEIEEAARERLMQGPEYEPCSECNGADRGCPYCDYSGLQLIEEEE